MGAHVRQGVRGEQQRELNPRLNLNILKSLPEQKSSVNCQPLSQLIYPGHRYNANYNSRDPVKIP